MRKYAWQTHKGWESNNSNKAFLPSSEGLYKNTVC